LDAINTSASLPIARKTFLSKVNCSLAMTKNSWSLHSKNSLPSRTQMTLYAHGQKPWAEMT
jgi:hypothetical protein